MNHTKPADRRGRIARAVKNPLVALRRIAWVVGGKALHSLVPLLRLEGGRWIARLLETKPIRALEQRSPFTALTLLHERVLSARGQRAYETGQLDEAEWLLSRGARWGRFPQTLLFLARVKAARGDVRGGISLIEDVLERRPTLAAAHLLAALLYEQRQDSKNALHHLRLAFDHTPDPDVRTRAVRIALRLEVDEDMLPWVREVIHRPGLDAMTRENLRVLEATALWHLGRQEDAEEIFSSLTNEMAQLAEVRCHIKSGDALAGWEKLQQLQTEDLYPRAVNAVAGALRGAGHLHCSIEAWDLARRVQPKFEEAQEAHREVSGELHVLSGGWGHQLDRIGFVQPKPNRVLHIVGKSLPYTLAGYTVRTQYTVKAQQEVGLCPHVVTKLGFPWSEGVMEASLVEPIESIPHHRLYSPCHREPLDIRLSANVDAASEIVRRVRPQIIHAASDFENALVALALGDAFGIPVVYEVRGFWEETWLSNQAQNEAMETERYHLRREREFECMSRADAVITLSEIMREQIIERGIEPEKVSVVPNAVDPDAFPLVTRDQALADRLGISSDEVTIGYISSFSPYEGIRYLVDATARLVERGLPVKCLLVGDGKERAALERQVEDLGLSKHVIITGRIPHDQILTYYGLIDVFVVPRTNDRVCHLVTPLKPYEAMATGRALIVSRTRALSELANEGQTGLTFTPEDADGLANVLGPLITDPDHRHALGKAARAWVHNAHTWADNASRYQEVYGSLA